MIEFELVLPCYNEAKSLPRIIERAISAAALYGYNENSFQLVLVENGSTDNSLAVLDQLSCQPIGRWFRTVRVPVNNGYGCGIWSGLKTTQAPYVAWSHADEQTDPKDAFEALRRLKESGNPKLIVKGARSGRSWKDRFVTYVFESIARVLLGLPTNEINAQPKVFRRELLQEVVSPPLTFAFDLYVLYRAARSGYQFDALPVVFHPRIHGFSNWSHGFFRRYKSICGMIAYIWRLRVSEGRI